MSILLLYYSITLLLLPSYYEGTSNSFDLFLTISKKFIFLSTFAKMQKYLFRNGFTIWKTVVHMHAKVDLLYLKKRKHRIKLRFNQWYTWSALRKQAKRTIVIAMQRHLKSMNQYYLHHSWRKWGQQIHGG